MIKSFRCSKTKALYTKGYSSRFSSVQDVALEQLEVLNAAHRLNDLKTPPGNHLEKLHGDREGRYSIRINKQWRICFTWYKGNAWGVEIVDYH